MRTTTGRFPSGEKLHLVLAADLLQDEMWDQNASMPQRRRKANDVAAVRDHGRVEAAETYSGEKNDIGLEGDDTSQLRSSAEPGCSYECTQIVLLVPSNA